MVTNNSSRVHSFQTGFTLVELLVVMTLMSIVVLAMAGALRGMGQTEMAIERRLERMDEYRVGSGFIRATLSRISARRSEVLQSNGKPSIQFEGSAESVAWLGVMPAREGAGGRYFFTLGIESLAGKPESFGKNLLVVRFIPFIGRPAPLDWSQSDWRVLANDVDSFALEYEDRRGVSTNWTSTWGDRERLPASVRLKVKTSSGDWPPITIPLRQMPQSASAGSGVATFGGGATQ